MMIDPIAKVFAVRAPDIAGPDRTGHGIVVLTTAKWPQDALIQAPLHLQVGIRDHFDWNHAVAYECKQVGVRSLSNGAVRITLDIP